VGDRAEHELPPILLMQRPSAHMTAQGAREINSGATPMATSQLQLKASPVPNAAIVRMINPRRQPT
jgi:hypothetical protein